MNFLDPLTQIALLVGICIFKWAPGAFDRIVRTMIVWRRRNDLVNLGDATFAPPDDTDEMEDG